MSPKALRKKHGWFKVEVTVNGQWVGNKWLCFRADPKDYYSAREHPQQYGFAGLGAILRQRAHLVESVQRLRTGRTVFRSKTGRVMVVQSAFADLLAAAHPQGSWSMSADHVRRRVNGRTVGVAMMYRETEEEARRGAPLRQWCPACDGSGHKHNSMRSCSACKGSGLWTKPKKTKEAASTPDWGQAAPMLVPASVVEAMAGTEDDAEGCFDVAMAAATRCEFDTPEGRIQDAVSVAANGLRALALLTRDMPGQGRGAT